MKRWRDMTSEEQDASLDRWSLALGFLLVLVLPMLVVFGVVVAVIAFLK